jgi:hypothetical protein
LRDADSKGEESEERNHGSETDRDDFWAEQLPLTTGARPKNIGTDGRSGELSGRSGDRRGLTRADVLNSTCG